MSLSLREQLLAAGLVSEQQVQRAERQQKQQQYTAPRGKKKQGPSQAELFAQRAAADKAAKDAELNRRKEEKLQRRARFGEIKQLVAAHQVPRVETDDFYNFQDGTNIKRVPVNPDLRYKLVHGVLAIVRCEGRYAFVPAEVGEQVRTRVERALIHLNKPEAAPRDDDPYKDYVVPDDLVW